MVIPSEASGEGDVILAQKKKMVDGKYSDDKIKREKVIQKNWDEKNPVEGRNQKGDIQRRDAQEEGHFDEELGDIFLVWQTSGSGLRRKSILLGKLVGDSFTAKENT